MAVGRSASLKIDWANLGTKLGLRGSTAQSLATFKSATMTRAAECKCSNSAIIDDIEKQVNSFQVKKYDVNRQLKAIDAFEAQAVKSAEETKGKVDTELKDLEKTLQNIESARPFEELTTHDVAKARPDVEQRATELVSKGRWQVPGYKERFGDLSLL
ncbi:hypothetical protein AMS68_006680 [Peltaster fructicola]|uniref:ATP synthase subunit d, mitochondrial n=1 Tax=Peltaster fructicola TaxID=286661 RepID=A0A6H0Y2B3_9PEZI|nr:hypothetical protein AMS68_006680 [Peltaster fructicola]